jgi:hypothetical protein
MLVWLIESLVIAIAIAVAVDYVLGVSAGALALVLL